MEPILTPAAITFLENLHRKFNVRRLDLLAKRQERHKNIQEGQIPDFLKETASIRDNPDWKVASSPKDLQKRWVEITGPTDRKMLINAMNSGADVFMADFEDSNTPTWDNMLEGQVNLRDTVLGTIAFTSPEGKRYALKDNPAVLLVRPRGWHLNEKHFKVDGEEISGSLFDFGLYFFHNAKKLMEKGSGPYFYLAKMESHLEAALWNDVFVAAQEALKIPQGTIRATVLIETILAAFEMEEILFVLKDHIAGLNAGRWDYIFSIIKTFYAHLPDRDQVTMTVPFMRAYSELIVKTCHKRGAHAMGGMAAFIPNRKDVDVTERALRKVREDKTREATDGFDGTWVAHPDLVTVAREIFEKALKGESNQKNRLRSEVKVNADQLLNFKVPGGTVTEEGLRHNIRVALIYLNSWLSGRGAVAIDNLMEDVATAEISRAQAWEWIQSGTVVEEGKTISKEWVKELIAEYSDSDKARKLFEELVLKDSFDDFLTLSAYKILE